MNNLSRRWVAACVIAEAAGIASAAAATRLTNPDSSPDFWPVLSGRPSPHSLKGRPLACCRAGSFERTCPGSQSCAGGLQQSRLPLSVDPRFGTGHHGVRRRTDSCAVGHCLRGCGPGHGDGNSVRSCATPGHQASGRLCPLDLGECCWLGGRHAVHLSGSQPSEPINADPGSNAERGDGGGPVWSARRVWLRGHRVEFLKVALGQRYKKLVAVVQDVIETVPDLNDAGHPLGDVDRQHPGGS
jgi:hypothetical protein